MPAMDTVAGNIFFIGLMGAGKTTHGKQLAALLQRDFIDSDQLICERTGVSISTIFELEGEGDLSQAASRTFQTCAYCPPRLWLSSS